MAECPLVARRRRFLPRSNGGRLQFPAATLVELRRVALHPTTDRGVVRRKAPLDQKFLDVPIRQREPEIPTHRAKNNLRFEVSPTGYPLDSPDPNLLCRLLCGFGAAD